MTAIRIASKLWWKNQELFPVDIIPPWFSVLIYHLADEWWVCWWPQFRYIL
jgi:hypothetical protein